MALNNCGATNKNKILQKSAKHFEFLKIILLFLYATLHRQTTQKQAWLWYFQVKFPANNAAAGNACMFVVVVGWRLTLPIDVNLFGRQVSVLFSVFVCMSACTLKMIDRRIDYLTTGNSRFTMYNMWMLYEVMLHDSRVESYMFKTSRWISMRSLQCSLCYIHLSYNA